MVKKKKKDCWVDNTNVLFTEYTLIPHAKMTLACRINCITRLLFYTVILLLLFQIFNPELIIIYFLTALLIIIMVYYKEKEKMQRKNYKNNNNITENFEINYSITSPKQQTLLDCSTQKARINYNCKKNDDNTFVLQKKMIKENIKQNDYTKKNNYNTPEYNKNFSKFTDNQCLVGGPNPKTLVPPIIAPPLASLEDWKNDDSYGISIVNEKKNSYSKESGYEVNDNCENYSIPRKPYYCAQKKNKPATSYNKINESKPDVLPPKPILQPLSDSKEPFLFPYEINSNDKEINNTDNLFHKDFKNNTMFHGKYNENIFTQTISPGNYKQNTRNEPINSNIGISLAEQNEPPNYEMIEPFEDVNTSNVYDPRFYGYGTSYRGYVDKNLGQPRFYYDDVDAIRMPNYISRNKIDVMPFGDAYGPDNTGGNKHHSNINALADQHYLDSSIQFRTEMQDRLMRKINANQWQQRMYPINTNGQRM